MQYKDGLTATATGLVIYLDGRHPSDSMKDLRKLTKDTYCKTGGENRGEEREPGEGEGKPPPSMPTKLYQKTVQRKNIFSLTEVILLFFF